MEHNVQISAVPALVWPGSTTCRCVGVLACIVLRLGVALASTVLNDVVCQSTAEYHLLLGCDCGSRACLCRAMLGPRDGHTVRARTGGLYASGTVRIHRHYIL